MAIHEAMMRSKSTAAHFTYVEEIECTNLVAARERKIEETIEDAQTADDGEQAKGSRGFG